MLRSALFAFQVPQLRLSGGRVHIRPPQPGDWRGWASLREASRAFLMPWEPLWPVDALTRAAYRRRLGRYAADWRDGEGYSFLIFRNGDGALLGGIGLSNVRRGVAQTGSLGYWIGAEHARKGYMSEALALILGFAFEQLRLHRVEAACLPTNDASRSLLKKLSFSEEGYARQYLCIDGYWQDHLLFAIVLGDWQESRRRPTAKSVPATSV